MSTLQLRYSEAYDASLSFWTGALKEQYFADHYNDWTRDYVTPAQRYIANAQSAWNAIDSQVFAAFRRFGYQFFDFWVAYGVHHWPSVVGYKDPLTFFIGDDLDTLIVLIIHELVHCHEDYPINQPQYEQLCQHIFARFPDEPIAVKYHIITLFVQWAVMHQVFPTRWAELVPISHQHPLLQRAADIIKEHESLLDYDHPLTTLLTL